MSARTGQVVKAKVRRTVALGSPRTAAIFRASRNAWYNKWRKGLTGEARLRYLANRRVYNRRAAIKLKREVMCAYGGKCECCGESRLHFLTIDHPNGGGTKHRKSISVGSGAMYRWLKTQGYPKGYRVQCFQCNCGRAANGGVCPHKEKRPLYC